jgi:hypothetical protein
MFLSSSSHVPICLCSHLPMIYYWNWNMFVVPSLCWPSRLPDFRLRFDARGFVGDGGLSSPDVLGVVGGSSSASRSSFTFIWYRGSE